MNTGQISNPSIYIKPSKKLFDYISTVKVSSDIPVGIANVIYKNKKNATNSKPAEPQYLITDEDRQFLNTLKLNSKVDITKLPLYNEAIILDSDKLLNLQDLHWLYSYMQKDNEDKSEKVYLHNILEGSEIVLPKNSEIPRNAELEKRCERLRASQQNREYNSMTKNVDNVRRKHPEDTISFQSKYGFIKFKITSLSNFSETDKPPTNCHQSVHHVSTCWFCFWVHWRGIAHRKSGLWFQTSFRHHLCSNYSSCRIIFLS